MHVRTVGRHDQQVPAGARVVRAALAHGAAGDRERAARVRADADARARSVGATAVTTTVNAFVRRRRSAAELTTQRMAASDERPADVSERRTTDARPRDAAGARRLLAATARPHVRSHATAASRACGHARAGRLDHRSAGTAASIAADACERLAQLLIDREEHESAIGVCERGLAIDELHDGLWRLAVVAQQQHGNHAAAARTRRDYERVLDRLGVVANGAGPA